MVWNLELLVTVSPLPYASQTAGGALLLVTSPLPNASQTAGGALLLVTSPLPYTSQTAGGALLLVTSPLPNASQTAGGALLLFTVREVLAGVLLQVKPWALPWTAYASALGFSAVQRAEVPVGTSGQA